MPKNTDTNADGSETTDEQTRLPEPLTDAIQRLATWLETIDLDRDRSTTTLESWAASGARLGQLIGRVLVLAATGYMLALGAFAFAILQFLPGRDRLFNWFINVGHTGLEKRRDAIVNVIYEDGVVVPRGATWQSKDGAFVTTNGETFYAEGVGYNPRRLNGKTPVVWALRMGVEILDPIAASIARERKRGNYAPFVRLADQQEDDVAIALAPEIYGSTTEFDVPAGGDGASASSAGVATDGGAVEAYDGVVVSFRDAWELFGSMVTQEDMKEQETRGKLAVLDWDRKDQLKLALIILGAVALGLFGPAIASAIVSGGGGAILDAGGALI